ncbi:MAG: thermonuclease family protein [Chthoniobacterales bacterium]
MKHVRKVCSFVCLLLASVALAQAPTLHCRVVVVTGGDTVTMFTEQKQRLKIRLDWIDAPELGQPFGYRAKQALWELVFGKKVELRPFATDQHGRLVCLVFVEGKDAGLEMLKQGFAWTYSHDFPEAPPEIQPSYREAADKARASQGRLRRLSTKETRKRKAQRIANAYQAAATQKRTLAHTRAAIEKLQAELAQAN